MAITSTVNDWRLDATRGVQARREYVTALVSLRQLAKFLREVDPAAPAELRAQRALNRTRVPKIAKYVLDNPDDYCFTALAGTVDGAWSFEPASKGANHGVLTIPKSCKIDVADGQHRRAAIEAAVAADDALGKKSRGLADETIPVMLFAHRGLPKEQQRFEDLNGNGVRTAGSIEVLYDTRDPHAVMARAVVAGVPLWKGMIEQERAGCAGKSLRLFALSAVCNATRELTAGSGMSEAATTNTAIKFWKAVCAAMPAWQKAVGLVRMSDRGHAGSPAALRAEYVHAHAVALEALGHVGNALIRADPKGWEAKVAKLGEIDWSRQNGEWKDRCIIGGDMSKRRVDVVRTANLIKFKLGLTLGVDDLRHESPAERAVFEARPAVAA